MSWRYKGGFIQEFFDPLTQGPADSFQLYAWGANGAGQLGQNDVISRSSPVQVGSLTTWSNIACGTNFSLSTKTDGTLWSWGRNDYGQLGQNNITYRSSPVQVGSLTTWLNVACGSFFSLSTKTDGTLWSWGYNNAGQLGQNISYLINRSSPTQVGLLATWSRVSCSDNSSAAIKSDGTLWTWGNNFQGELGQNISYLIKRSSPTQVGSLATWSKIACGSYHMVATTAS